LSTFVGLALGAFTLGLPMFFGLLDQRDFPRMRWIEDDEPTPWWGHMVVVVGVILAVLVALAAPISGFHPTH